MRIALACPYAWDAPGGVQTHVRQLSVRLRERGHRVLVLAPSRRAPREDGVRIVGRPAPIRYQGTVAPICFSPASRRRVREALAAFVPDVLHAHEPLAPSTSLLAVMSSQCPVVATFHAYAERSALFDLAAPLLRPVWRRLAVRIAVSQAARSFVASRLGDGMRVIPNGVDVDVFADARPAELPPGQRILWVGRLDAQKGFSVALQAFSRLASDRHNLWLVVAGDGADRVAARRLPIEIRARLVMLGTISHEHLPDYHAAADVFVSPATGQESFGISLVEAMAAGLPVVATDIPGYREVVRDGVEGLLVPPRDPAALAGAISGILDDPEAAKLFGEAGRERARRYAWDTVAEEVEEAYREVVRGP